MKIALFDFCETLANFQTADPFVSFCVDNHGNFKTHFRRFALTVLIRFKFLAILKKVFSLKTTSKQLLLSLIRGMKREDIEYCGQRYYNEIVKPNLIKEMIDILKQMQSENYEVYIVSGGYNVYLQYFMEDFQIPSSNLLCSCLGFKDDICTGKLTNIDCMGKQKVVLLNSLFNHSDVESIAFSDSKSDIPFLDWAGEAFIVRRSDRPSWDIQKKYKEIVWKR